MENPDTGSKHKFMCCVCQQTGLNRRDVRNHVESRHFPDAFTYTCELCSRVMKTKKALNNHKYTKHRAEFDLLFSAPK